MHLRELQKQRRGLQSKQQLGLTRPTTKQNRQRGAPSGGDDGNVSNIRPISRQEMQPPPPTINDRVDANGKPLKTLHKFTSAQAWSNNIERRPDNASGLLEQRQALISRGGQGEHIPLIAAKKKLKETPPLLSFGGELGGDHAGQSHDVSVSKLFEYGTSHAIRANTPNMTLTQMAGQRGGLAGGGLRPASRAQTAPLEHDPDDATNASYRSAGAGGFHSMFVPRSLVPLAESKTTSAVPQMGHPNHILNNAHHAAQQRLQFFQWAQSFERERDAFSSVGVWAEIVMCQAMEATKGAPVPCPLRTAVCALVLDRLVAHREQCGLPVVMGIIKTELLNAIYANHHVDLSKMIGDTAGHHQPGSESHELPSGSGGPLPVKNGAPAFYDMKMYSQKASKLEKRVEELLKQQQDAAAHHSHPRGGRGGAHDGKSGGLPNPFEGGRLALSTAAGFGNGLASVLELRRIAEMRGNLNASERIVKRIFFTSWKGMIKKNRQVADAASAWVRIATRSSSHFLTAEFFRKWKKYLSYKKDNEKKLQDRVEALEKLLEEKEEQIKQMQFKMNRMDSRISTASGSRHMSPKHQAPVEELEGVSMRLTEDDTEIWGPGSTSPRGAIGRKKSIADTHAGRAGEDAPFVGIEKMNVPQYLEFWIREMINSEPEYKGVLKLSSIDGGLCDGHIYTALLHIMYPESGVDICREIEDTSKRIDRLMSYLEGFGLDKEMITATDIANATIANISLVAWLYLEWYEMKREEIQHLETSTEYNNVLFSVTERLNLTRMIPEGFHMIANKVIMFVNTVLMKRVRTLSKESASAVADMADFTIVRDFYFGEFEERLDVETEISIMVPMLRSHYTDLKKVYEFYRGLSATNTGQGGGLGQAATALTVKDFWKFVDDCKLATRPGISVGLITQALPVPNAASRSASSQQLLSKKQFIEMLVRMACTTTFAQGKLMDKGAVTNQLELLIEQQILPRAMVSAKLDFKQRVSEVRIQEIFSSSLMNKNLSRVYRHYSTMDNTGRQSMTRDKFVQMLNDLHLIDKQSGMKRKDIISIFAEVQDEGGDAPSPGAAPLVGNAASPAPDASLNPGGADDNELMSQTEFNEALVAIAMFKVPHPMIALHIRVQQFLNQTFLPALRTHLNLKK